MKRIIFAAAITSLGNAALAQDWSGYYGGLQAANIDYSNTYLNNGTAFLAPFEGSGSMSGVFLGFNRQAGTFLLGGEIAYLSGEAALDSFPAYYFSDMLDLKARAGYSLGRVLPYAVVGWSTATWINDAIQPVNADGYTYGIGAEVLVTDRIVVGLEYLKRNLDGDPFLEFPTQNIESDFSTVTLRLGYTF